MLPDLVGKQLELLKEVLPKVSRVALLGPLSVRVMRNKWKSLPG